MSRSLSQQIQVNDGRASANRPAGSHRDAVIMPGFADMRPGAIAQRRLIDALKNESGTPDHLENKIPALLPKQVLQKVAASQGNSVIQFGKRTKEDENRLLKRLRASYRRNKKRKAKPRFPRYIFRRQAEDNYNYKNAEIVKLIKDKKISNALTLYNPQQSAKINPSYTQLGVGDIRGYYRKGFGNQPFLYLNSEAYKDKMIPSNYDDIIKYFKGQDMEMAEEILKMIESGGEMGDDKSGQAKSLFVLLTQFIEAHNTRIPGSDKLARALLRRIAMGQLTFQEAFNRKNGLFVSAWAKGGGASVGGQKAGRALFGEDREKDKYGFDKLESHLGKKRMEDLYDTIEDYYSDESDEEGDYDMDEETMPSRETVIDKDAVKKINEALTDLGLSDQISDMRNIQQLPLLWTTIRKNYKKLAVMHHPDKGGDPAEYRKVNEAEKYLMDVIDLYKAKGIAGLRANALDDLLRQNHLRTHEVRGDGNCFYAAILDQIAYLDGRMVDMVALRGRVAQLILDNAAMLQVFATGFRLNQIVYDILTSRSWANVGGDFAPQLIATVLRRPVRIIQPTGIMVINPRTDLTLNVNNTYDTGGRSMINIVYNGSTHYDSTRSTIEIIRI